MSNPTENDLFMSAFEPIPNNRDGNRRNTRRSSILKTTEVNYEERRASRRVSWAQTYQYKELLADGTTVVMLQELNSHQKTKEEIEVTSDPPQEEEEEVEEENNNDENKDQNCIKTDGIINASALISRIKAISSSSMNKSFSETSNKRQNNDQMNTSVAKKPRKAKKNSSKGLTKYLSKHYEIDDQKDYETVCNTSFNKYGRELVPRTERADFTQLFAEDNDMNITKMTENNEQNQTNRLSLTLNETFLQSSQESENKTTYFTDQSLAITDNTTNVSISNTTDNSVEDLPEDEQSSVADTDHKNGNDFNKSFSVYSVESFRRNDRQDLSQLFSSNSMNLIDFTQPLDKLKLKDQIRDQFFNEDSVEMSISQDSHLEEVVESLEKDLINESQQKFTSNEDNNQTKLMSLTLASPDSVSAHELSKCVTKDNSVSLKNEGMEQTKDDIEAEASQSISNISMSIVSNAVSIVTSTHFLNSPLEVSKSPAEEESVKHKTEEWEQTKDEIKNHELNEVSVDMSFSQNSGLEEVVESPQKDQVNENELKVTENEDNNQTNLMSLTLASPLEVSKSVTQNKTQEEDEEEDSVSQKTEVSEETRDETESETSESIVDISMAMSIVSNPVTPITSKSKCTDSVLSPMDISISEAQHNSVSQIAEHLEQRTDQLNVESVPNVSVMTNPINSIHLSVSALESSKFANDITVSQKTEELEQRKDELNTETVPNISIVSNPVNSTHLSVSTQESSKFVSEDNSVLQKTQVLEQTKYETKREKFSFMSNLSVVSNAITPKVSKNNSIFEDNANRQTVRMSYTMRSLASRMEMSKSHIKDMFGLGITERLKQKRDEIEAKSRQNNITTAFTPSASNSISVIDSKHTLNFSSVKNVSQLSTDLFNSKSNIETEDMEVDDQSITNAEEPQALITTEDKCETNEKMESDDPNESNSELKNSEESEEKESNSVTNSDSKGDSDENESNSVVESQEVVTNTSSPSMPSSLAISSISSSSSSDNSSLELNNTSPLSVSIVHSSDNFLVSSPTTIDPTLNFTFDASDSSNSFDPFVHTNTSFHTNHSFYETSSPMQLSFMLREDTLCILADELERQMEDIVIPVEEQKLSVSTTEELSDMFLHLRKLDAKQNGFTYEVLSEEKALISYLWGTFALEVRFGSVVEDPNTPFTVRHILSINMKSLISSEEALQMRQKDLILKFNDFHKPLITIAHDLIISSFESERQQIVSRHKTSASLHQLVSDISVKVLSARNLLTELRAISSSEICRLCPKQDDRYRLVIEILGIRKPIYLILPINPKSYPDEVIRPEIRMRNEDKHLYCLEQFSAAFRLIEPRKFDYIRRLIRGTKAFVRAKKKIIFEKQKSLKQKNEIKFAKLPDSLTKTGL